MTNTTATETTITLCACGNVTYVVDGQDIAPVQCRRSTTRTFAPGHDARLKGNLIRAAIAGHDVRLPSGELVSPQHIANGFGFGWQVARGLELGLAKIAMKVGKAKVSPVPATPKTITAKVGRWFYEGVVAGGEFVYTDKKGATQTTAKFAQV